MRKIEPKGRSTSF